VKVAPTQETHALERVVRDLVQEEIRRLVKSEALLDVEPATSLDEDPEVVRRAHEAAARIRRARPR